MQNGGLQTSSIIVANGLGLRRCWEGGVSSMIFLPRDAMLARYMLSSCVSFLLPNISAKFERGHLPREAPNACWVG